MEKSFAETPYVQVLVILQRTGLENWLKFRTSLLYANVLQVM